MQHILVIDDDLDFSALLYKGLNTISFNVTLCETGEQGWKNISARPYDLIILDISLPDMNGMELCRRIRSSGLQIPVLMLTSHNNEEDKVLALHLGADDYLTKPVSFLELAARVKSKLRRAASQESLAGQHVLKVKELVIDVIKRVATIKSVRLNLTVKEFDLLWLLAANPGKTFSRKELLQEVWGTALKAYEHTITAHINRLKINSKQMVTQQPILLPPGDQAIVLLIN